MKSEKKETMEGELDRVTLIHQPDIDLSRFDKEVTPETFSEWLKDVKEKSEKEKDSQ